ncbi:hypothetical protein [Nocardia wallacei]|uniref:hypothetical protein n=1 Tax=Nocardia wallacei TaxID=480035 RepID=UPI002453EE41|nr:hypothetical protein [Nocardia wallacei]
MTSFETMLDIAAKVLSEARYLDNKIQLDPGTTAAWARCFDGQKVFPTEALAAVHAHYRQPNAFPIKPGDIIAYCATQPIWSSEAHVRHFLAEATQYPYSTLIEDYSGIRPPETAIPDTAPIEQRRQHRIDEISEWVNTHRNQLVTAILNRRHKSVHS